MLTHSTAPSDLPDHCQAVLFGVVTSFPGKGKTALLKLLRTMSVSDANGKLLDIDSLTPIVESLEREGWIVAEERREGRYLSVPLPRRNGVLLNLLMSARGEEWLSEIKAGLPPLSEWQTPLRARVLQDLWLNLLNGNLAALARSLVLATPTFTDADSPDAHPMHLLLADPDGLEVLSRLDDDTRTLLLVDHLNLRNNLLGPADQSYALALQEMEVQPTGVLGFEILLQALWRGDWETLQSLEADELALLQQTCQLLLAGDVQGTLLLLRGWLTEMRRLTKKRRIDLPPLLNAFYCLALFAENDPAQRASLKQAIALGIKEKYGAAYNVFQHLLEQLQGESPSRASFYLPNQLNGLDGLLMALALYWLDASEARQDSWRIELQDYRDQLVQERYLWLAAEFDALIAAQFGQPRQFADVHQSAGLKPLVKLWQRQEAWEHALNALSQLRLNQASGTPSADEQNTRLAWLISVDEYWKKVEPREQKRNAKGQWSKGRAIALKRLMEDGSDMDFLCDQDRQAINAIQLSYHYSSPEYELPLTLALPRLVGHPAVYWYDAPEVRIDLHAGQAALHLQANEQHIRVHLEPEGIVDANEIYVHKETPTRLLVYPISRELRKIMEIVGQGLSVPNSAKRQLIEAISAIAPLLPVHSDILELTGHLDKEAADTRLYAHLPWTGQRRQRRTGMAYRSAPACAAVAQRTARTGWSTLALHMARRRTHADQRPLWPETAQSGASPAGWMVRPARKYRAG